VGAWRNRELRSFKAQGGRVVLGAGVGRAALLGRSRRLAQESAGVVAFLFGASRGSVFTVREAIRSGKPVAVVLAGGGAVLPAFPGGTWAPCSIAGVAAHRWVPGAERPNGDDGDTAPSALHRIFVVPEGEPTGALLTHISSLTQGERLGFEQAVLVGEVVLMPHEALSDTPAFLALPRLRRRFRCSVGEAAGLGELFLALEAGPGVVAHYEREARRYGVELVLEQLLRLVVQLALVEDVAETDALTDAERLGDGVDDVDVNGRVALAEGRGGGELLAWHVVGAVQREAVACPGCGGRYVVDDEEAETPVCPGCGAPDTWEARKGEAFVALVAEIDGCPSLEALAVVGKQLYARGLPHEQASVAWSHYQLRKRALEAAVTLGAAARALVEQVKRAWPRELAAVGARLHRLQHSAGAPTLASVEWRRVWAVYHARRAAHAA
jgi:hypothetical protein